LIVDKAQTEAQRQILKLIFSRQTMGRRSLRRRRFRRTGETPCARPLIRR
jgi:hypothetical protein